MTNETKITRETEMKKYFHSEGAFETAHESMFGYTAQAGMIGHYEDVPVDRKNIGAVAVKAAAETLEDWVNNPGEDFGKHARVLLHVPQHELRAIMSGIEDCSELKNPIVTDYVTAMKDAFWNVHAYLVAGELSTYLGDTERTEEDSLRYMKEIADAHEATFESKDEKYRRIDELENPTRDEFDQARASIRNYLTKFKQHEWNDIDVHAYLADQREQWKIYFASLEEPNTLTLKRDEGMKGGSE